jgi:hypothetical protein
MKTRSSGGYANGRTASEKEKAAWKIPADEHSEQARTHQTMIKPPTPEPIEVVAKQGGRSWPESIPKALQKM